jgi:hypothetical protein
VHETHKTSGESATQKETIDVEIGVQRTRILVVLTKKADFGLQQFLPDESIPRHRSPRD